MTVQVSHFDRDAKSLPALVRGSKIVRFCSFFRHMTKRQAANCLKALLLGSASSADMSTVRIRF